MRPSAILTAAATETDAKKKGGTVAQLQIRVVIGDGAFSGCIQPSFSGTAGIRTSKGGRQGR